MKRTLLLAAITFLTTSIAIGQNAPNIINSFPSPNQSTYIGDIAFDGKHIWVQGFDEYLLHQISPVNGSIIKSIPTEVQRLNGLTFDGTHLWLTDTDNKIIQQIDTLDGAVILSFPVPTNPDSSYPGGLASDGTSLWLNDPKTSIPNGPIDTTLRISTSGEVLEAYQAMGNYPTGLAFDGEFLWSADNVAVRIYKIDISTFSKIDSIEAPGGAYPNGLAFDGQYLWVANNDSDSLYQLDIGYFPPNSINEFPGESNRFTVFPNPSSGQFTFEKNTELVAEELSLNVYSITGQLILKKEFEGNDILSINLEQFKAQTFVYKILGSNQLIESGLLFKK
jgi:DNA-binding beta-propeller fold protein YncE